MATTLSYGFIKPQTGDKGSVFFPALETDIQKLNDHNHDGITSALISPLSVAKSTQSIDAANWISLGGGNYRQEVTLPSGYTLLQTIMRFEISGGGADGNIIYPSLVKGTSTNKFYVYINDNTLTLRALYF